MTKIATTSGSQSLLPWLVLALGVSLIPLLPIGIFIGTSGALYSLIFFVHVALMCGVAAGGCFELLRTARSVGALGVVLVAISLCAIGESLIVGTLPVTATDALVHHMAVPKWWVASDRIAEIAWHEWSYYPMLTQLAFAGFISHGTAELAAVYHGGYLLLVAALAVVAVREADGNAEISLLAGIVASGLPVFLKLAAAPMVDLPLALYALAAAVFALRWFSSGGLKYVAAAGVCLGLAMSTKYNGVLFTALFTAAFSVAGLRAFGAAQRKRVIDVAGTVTLLLSVAAIVFSPWMLKNFAWTGNPLYPLLKSVFGGPATGFAGGPGSLTPLQHRVFLYGENFFDLILLPVRILTTGADGMPAQFDGIASPILALGLLFMAVGSARTDARWMYGWLGVLYVLAALIFSSARVRYLAPALPLLAVGAALTIAAIAQRFFPRWQRALALGLSFYAGAVALHYGSTSVIGAPERAVLRGEVTRHDYLARALSEFELVEYTNQHLSTDSRVYLLGTTNRFYYFDVPVISRGYYSLNEVISLLKSGASPESLRRRLHDLGVTHLFVHTERMSEGVRAAVSPQELATWNSFATDNLEGIASSGGYSLWKLR